MFNAMICVGIGLGILLIYIIIALIDARRASKRRDEYCELFVECYNRTNDIKRTLIALQDEYSKNTKLSKSLTAAVDYLNCSIMRDYKTALGMVGKNFKNQTVNEMHEEYIEKARKQKRLLLENGGRLN